MHASLGNAESEYSPERFRLGKGGGLISESVTHRGLRCRWASKLKPEPVYDGRDGDAWNLRKLRLGDGGLAPGGKSYMTIGI